MAKTREKHQQRDAGLLDIGTIRAIARADFRSHRRRPAVWLIVLLAVGLTLAPAYYHAHLHEVRSGHLPIVGLFWPPFRLSEYGSNLVLLLALASCLLGFDARHRDADARIVDALDCRPMSNLALLLGRLLGIIGVTWLPCATLLALHELAANVASPLGFDGPAFGQAALVRLLFLDALPAVIFWSGVVLMLASVFRSRSLSLGVSLALVGLNIWGVANVPHYLLQAVSTFPDYSGLASDIVSQYTLPVLLQRLALVAVAAACIVAAARFHPRDDGVSHGPLVCIALGFGAIGVVGIAWIAITNTQEIGERDRWRATHSELANDAHYTPDVEKLSGTVNVDPGAMLAIDVAVEMKALPPSVRSLVFTFNPGMTVKKLLLDGQPTAFTHEDGGLVVGLPQAQIQDSAITLRIAATGIPDGSFAFLDGAFDPDRLPASNRAGLLGKEASLYQKDYVALTPWAYWLPATGPIHRIAARHDIFGVDLAVTVPEGWLAVGPGDRTLEHDEPPTYRFRPRNMVPGVALFAGPFRAYNARISDIEVELALHPRHLENAELLAPVSELVTADLAEMLAFAHAKGIPYPHETLRIVEVPTGLRTHGHRPLMQPVAAGSGVLLLKEAGWPVARLRREEGAGMAAQMRVFVANDSVSSLYDALARNILEPTWAAGDGATALDFVLHHLTRLTLSQTPPPVQALSAHNFNVRAHFGHSLRDLFNHAVDGESFGLFVRYTPLTDSSTVWHRALDVSLSSLDFRLDGKMAAAVLDLRGGALAQLLYDILGAEGAGALVQRLVTKHRGNVYTAEDIDALVSHPDAPSVREWITSNDCSGLLVSTAEVSRLEDDDDGTPRFHLSFHVRNDEASPGWFHVKEHYDLRYPFRLSEVTRVPPLSAVHVGLVLEKPPRGLWLHPYFSRNAGTVRIPLTEGAPRTSHDEPVVGSEPSTWRPQVEGIVVDDLSPGFTVIEEPPFGTDRPGLRRTASDGVVVLPSNRESPGQTGWSRDWAPSTWGKYRATMVHAPSGTGRKMALFLAELGRGGRWRLDYHMPNTQFVLAPGKSLGSLEITVSASGLPEPKPLVFDAMHADPGWSALGTFDLPAGETRVAVSDRTDGTHVIVDAVRWVQAD